MIGSSNPTLAYCILYVLFYFYKNVMEAVARRMQLEKANGLETS